VSLRARLNAGYAPGAWSASHNGDDEEVWLVLTTRQGLDSQLPSGEPALESRTLRSVLDLGVKPREVLHAREFLLTSELVTNAIEASLGRTRMSQVQLAILSDGTQLVIVVRVAAHLDDLLKADGELVTLVRTAEVVAPDDVSEHDRNPACGQSAEARAAITEISGPVGDLGLLADGSAGREIATGRLGLVENHSPRLTGTRSRHDHGR
jgi:hypothetical protein